MEKYLKVAARAWARATLNIKKFADAYVGALGKFGEKAAERFSAAYPMFGEREWSRLCKIGNGELLPQFFFKSDFFIGKLLKLNSSMRIQKALVGASSDGRIRIDRGNGPEKVKIADLTRNEDKALILLLSEESEKLSPDKLKLKYRTLVANVNKSNKKCGVRWSIHVIGGKRVAHINRACNLDRGDIDFLGKRLSGARRIGVGGRMPADIMSDLVNAVISLNSLRDDEWDFEERNGLRDMWNDEVVKEHDMLLEDIQNARNNATRLVREATGNDKLEV